MSVGLTVSAKISEIVEVFQNYKASPLIYSTPYFTYMLPRPKINNYREKCSFCKFLLIRCTMCVKNGNTYDLLDRFKTWVYKTMPADENIIKSWIDKIAIEKCSEFMSYTKSLKKEFDDWKSLSNGEQSVVDYLKWTKIDNSVHQKSLTALKLWCTSQENKNDLLEFMLWVNKENPDVYARLVIALDNWLITLNKHRQLCNIRYLAYKKIKSKKEFDELLHNCKNLSLEYLPVASMLTTDAYQDSMDSLLIIRL